MNARAKQLLAESIGDRQGSVRILLPRDKQHYLQAEFEAFAQAVARPILQASSLADALKLVESFRSTARAMTGYVMGVLATYSPESVQSELDHAGVKIASITERSDGLVDRTSELLWRHSVELDAERRRTGFRVLRERSARAGNLPEPTTDLLAAAESREILATVCLLGFDGSVKPRSKKLFRALIDESHRVGVVALDAMNHWAGTLAGTRSDQTQLRLHAIEAHARRLVLRDEVSMQLSSNEGNWLASIPRLGISSPGRSAREAIDLLQMEFVETWAGINLRDTQLTPDGRKLKATFRAVIRRTEQLAS